MPNLDGRRLLPAGVLLAVLFGGMSLLSGQQSTDHSNSSVGKPEEDGEGKSMQVQYLEIVTSDVDALCKQYSAIHGVTFSEPNAQFGNARTAQLNGGGLIGIRGPLRDTETPVIRPYVLVDNLEAAVAAAADAGAEIALPRMELAGHGAIAIVIQGGIECGLWQL